MDEALIAAIEDAHNSGAGVWRKLTIRKLENGRLGLRIGGQWIPFPTDAAIFAYLQGLIESPLPLDVSALPSQPGAERSHAIDTSSLTPERLILAEAVPPPPPRRRRRRVLKFALLVTVVLTAVLIPLQHTLEEDTVVTIAAAPDEETTPTVPDDADDAPEQVADGTEEPGAERPSDPETAATDTGAGAQSQNAEAEPDAGADAADDTAAEDAPETDGATGESTADQPPGRPLTAHETLQAGDEESALNIFSLRITSKGHPCDAIGEWRYVRTDGDADLFAVRCLPDARYAVRIMNTGGMEYEVASCTEPGADAEVCE